MDTHTSYTHSSNTPIRRPTSLTTQNGIHIQSAVLPQYTFRTDRQTDTQTDRWDRWQVNKNTAYTHTLWIESDMLTTAALCYTMQDTVEQNWTCCCCMMLWYCAARLVSLCCICSMATARCCSSWSCSTDADCCHGAVRIDCCVIACWIRACCWAILSCCCFRPAVIIQTHHCTHAAALTQSYMRSRQSCYWQSEHWLKPVLWWF